MSDLPMMPWFPNDFRASTAGWTFDEKALYRELLDIEWDHGSIPADLNRIMLLAGLSSDRFEAAWPMVSTKFVEKDGRLINERCEKHRERARELQQQRSKAGKMSAESRKTAAVKSKFFKVLEEHQGKSQTEMNRELNERLTSVETGEQAPNQHPSPSPSPSTNTDTSNLIDKGVEGEKSDDNVRSAPVDNLVPRETEEPAPDGATKGKKPKPEKKRSQVTDVKLTEEKIQYAIEKLPDCDAALMFENFYNSHKAKGSLMLDWDAAWRTWVGNGLRYGYPRKKDIRTTVLNARQQQNIDAGKSWLNRGSGNAGN